MKITGKLLSGLLILSFLFFSIKNAFPQETLTWDDCVTEAKRDHPDLQSAREKVNQAIAEKRIVQSNILPQINGDLTLEKTRTVADVIKEQYSYGITGRQLLFDGFKSYYEIASASEDIKAAQYEYSVVSSNIRLRLRVAFIELLKAVQLVSITEEIATRRKQNLELVKLRYDAGREHRGALFTAEANYAQAEFEISSARRSISLAQRRIVKELGRRIFSPVYAQGELGIANLDTKTPDFEKIADTNPLLQSLIAKKESARHSIDFARGDFMPEVFANATADKRDERWLPREDEWTVGISVSIPLFEGGSKFAQLSRNKSAFNQAWADELSGRDGILLTLEDTWVSFQDAYENEKVQKKFLDAAEERAKIARAQYSTGLIGFDDWTIIEDNLVNARNNYLNATADLMTAEANWVQAEGKTLDYDK